MVDKIYKCDCKGWEKNIGYLDSIFVLAHIHHGVYNGDEFEYCPWCGEMLKSSYDEREEYGYGG